MKQLYPRFLCLFLFAFLLLGSVPALAYNWFYEIYHNKAEGRIYLKVAVQEYDCLVCDDNWLSDLDIDYSLDGGATYSNILRDAQKDNRRMGASNNGWIVNNGTSGNDDYSFQHYYINVPSEWLGKTVKIRSHYYWGDKDDVSGDKYNDFTIDGLATPTIAASSSNGEQTTLSLNWNNISDNGYGSGQIKYEIIRNGAYLATVNHGTTSYVDNTAADRTKYNYKIRVRVHYTVGSRSNTIDGPEKQVWKNPRMVLNRTQNPCEAGVTLTWTKPNLDATYSYIIKRSSSANFLDDATEFSVRDINQETYKDNTDLEHNKSYYYKILVIRSDRTEITALTSAAINLTTVLTPAAPVLATPVKVSADKYTVSWPNYNCSNVSGFELVYTTFQGNLEGVEKRVTLAANISSYTLEGLRSCHTYKVKVYALNRYQQKTVSNLVSITISETIENAFALSTTDRQDQSHAFYNHDYKFKASKGFYTNYIQLQWDALYKSTIQSYDIYRRIADNGTAFELVKVIEGGSATIWTDEFTESNTIYEYKIVGNAPCDGQIINTAPAYALGFRAPFGTINGKVSFEGGQGVENVQVRVRSSDGQSGKSIRFTNTTSSIDIAASAAFVPSQKGWSFEAWLRPDDANANFVLWDHLADGKGIKLAYVNREFVLTSGTEERKITPGTLFKSNEFSHVSVSIDATTLDVVWAINDSVFAEQKLVNGLIRHSNNNLPLFVGNSRTKDQGFKGVIDEIRLWSIPHTGAQFKRNHNRFLVGNETGLTAYWKADEGFGNYAFDGSRVDKKYNENHAQIKGSYEWSTIIPSENQLANVAYTDAKGDYKMTGIQFRGSGEAFEITPMLGVHKFDPTSMQIFIGEGSLSHNGKDFKDVSSFIAKGTVYYKDNSFPVQGVQVLVDGKAIISSENTPVMTNALGEFEAQVPIGKHTLSFVKNGHVFENGYWPAKNVTHDFQEHLRGQLEIIDTTKVLLKGRVAGGQVEEAKPLGMGLSVNNIGQALITLEPEKGGYYDSTKTANHRVLEFTTNLATGEFEGWVIPERFIIKKVETVKAKTDGSRYTFPEQAVLDLSLPVQSFTWDYRLNDKGVKVDSAKYHFAKKITLHTPAQWAINNGDLIGETSMKLSETGPEIDLSSKPFGAPILRMNTQYAFPLSFFEEYENADDKSISKVAITNATISLNNNWKAGPAREDLVLNNQQGILNYTFRAGAPNLTGSFTHNLSATIKISDQAPITFPAVSAYILGEITSGAGFLTKGPDVVEFVLRDPPGTGSYAFLSKGSSTTKKMSVSRTNGSTQEINPTLHLGTKATLGTGLGVFLVTESEAKAQVSNEEIISESHNKEGEFVETIEIGEGWETSSSPDMVGSMADLFVGKAMNFIIGKTENLELLPLEGAFAQLPRSQNTFTYQGKEYALVRRQGIAAAQDNFSTRFMYTQHHIENTLIPELKKFRNNLFTRGDGVYVSKQPKESENYGADNYDEQAFPSSFLAKSSEGVASRGQYTGPSYTFNPKKSTDPDSVYLINQQIKLWEKTLRDNEKNKLDAKTIGSKADNVSYDGGTNYTWEKSLSSEWGIANTFEVTADASLELVTGYLFNKFGIEMRVKAEYNHSSTSTTGDFEGRNLKFGYVLSDGDKGDYYSVDVIDPSKITFTTNTEGQVNWEDYYDLEKGQKDHKNGFYSPMFYTRGGVTSCPYEGEEVTRYYQPGKTLNAATMQREKPQLLVDNASVSGVPETNAAVFRLKLQNNSESEEDMWYGIQLDEASNKDGAILQIDGSSPNRAFNVPYGKTVEKILTVRKGPGAVYEYKDLGIILASLCQPEEIADTVRVSAYFEPACTPVTMLSPLNNWLANVDSKGVVPIQVSGYDINMGTFVSVELQYKSTASNTWATIQSYYNHVDDYNAALDKGEPAALIDGKTTITYSWNIADLPDRNYELRAKSTCADGSVAYSEVKLGLKDATPPLVFGTPQPADGILSPNDEIMIQFAEPIEAGLITKANINVTGVLNGSNRAHGSFLKFDGQQASVRIPDGVRLDDRSFTVEFWARNAPATGDRVVIAQGEGDQMLHIGFDAAGRLYTEWNGLPRVTANRALAANTWHHYAISFDLASSRLNLYGNDESLAEQNQASKFGGSGSMLIGKTAAGAKLYAGDLYALRTWDIYKSRDEVYALQSKNLNGTERGLTGCWPMDDLKGTGVRDLARALHGISTAQWVAEPASHAVQLSGNSYLTVPSGHTPITKNADFTLEFWLKAGASARETSLFSAALPNTDMKWSLDLDNKGSLFLRNHELLFKGIDNDVLDDKWHHIAMVADRRGNLSFYLDGELKNSRKADALTRLTADKLYFGVRYDAFSDANGTPQTTLTRHFKGNLDEIRLWNSARSAEQLNRSIHKKQPDNLPDLQIYLPFEAYQNNSGVMLSTTSAKEQSGKTKDVSATFTSASFTSESPLIDRPQPQQKVDFTYVINQDKILITLNEPAPLVEKTILDITVNGIMDKNSNAMQGSKTWSVFIDKNQVKWADSRRQFEKELYKGLTFEVDIVNQGGSQQNFSIEGLPGWLTAVPASDIIEPNSRKTIKITVEESLNIGNYSKDLYLRTGFGYDEKLALDLKVFAVPPKWVVNPSNFDKSMSVTGMVKINDRFSTNADDKVVALANGEVRGVAQLRYVAGYDRYMFFMDVYGNVNETEKVKFNIWNASLGVVHTDVTPAQLTFRDGEVYGTPAQPQILTASNEVYQDIALKKGWNWISFNVNVNQKPIETAFDPALLNRNSVLMAENWFAEYSAGMWSPPGKTLSNATSYLLRADAAAQLTMKGGLLNTANEPITLKEGWNWVGYTPQASMPVKDALASAILNPGDIIKGQTGFAIYDTYMGWVGSLSYLKSGEGYRVKSSKTQNITFTYPKASVNSGGRTGQTEQEKAFAATNQFFSILVQPTQFRHNMSLLAQIDSDQILPGSVIMATNANGQQVGWGIGQELGDKVVFFITLFGDQPQQELSFAYYDAQGKQLIGLQEKVTFRPDQTQGSLAAPFKFSTSGELKTQVRLTSFAQVFPNPFSEKVTIVWANTPDQETTLELYDLAGHKVATLWKGSQSAETGTFVWEQQTQPVAAGMYLLRVTHGSKQEIIKVVKW